MDFIRECDSFTPPFIDGLMKAMEIAKSNPNCVNMFLMREQRHSFDLLVIGNDIFMFDSVGQRYGRKKSDLGFKGNNDYLRLSEIPYTNMFLDFLKRNSEMKLHFNLNPLQQDTTNCFTFSIDFLDNLCKRFEKKPNVEDFRKYLVSFFPVKLEDNLQMTNEGSLDFLCEAAKSVPDEKQRMELYFQEVGARLVIPSELLVTSQLNTFTTDKVRFFSPVPFSEIMTANGESLEKELKSKEKPVQIMLKNGNVITKTVNRRIYDRRKEEETLLLTTH